MYCFFQIPLSAFPAVKELAAAYSHRRVRMRCRADFLFQRKALPHERSWPDEGPCSLSVRLTAGVSTRFAR